MNVIFRPVASLVGAHFPYVPRRLQLRSWVVACCLSVFLPLTVLAQSVDRDPLNAQTTAPLTTYQSAFSDYKPFQDPELMPWKTANDVVREFGSMVGMAGMADMKGSDSPANTGGNEPNSQPAKPSHDMSNMEKSKTRASGSNNPAFPDSKPDETKNMPGHDMSKMQSPKPKTPPPKRAPTPETKNKGVMTDMPGHDMGSMQQKAPPAPTTKPPPPSGKPVAPTTMPGMPH